MAGDTQARDRRPFSMPSSIATARVRLLVALALGVLLTTAAAGSAARLQEPPPGLTRYGQAVWNLDALLHDTFGSRRLCLRRSTFTLSRAWCRRSLAVAPVYAFTFRDARDSSFALVRRRVRPFLGNAAPIRIEGRFVSCGDGSWLAQLHGSVQWVLSCESP